MRDYETVYLAQATVGYGAKWQAVPQYLVIRGTTLPMRALLIILALCTGGSAYASYTAAQRLYDGTPWAQSVCSVAGGVFCKHPEWLAYGAAGFLLLALFTAVFASD